MYGASVNNNGVRGGSSYSHGVWGEANTGRTSGVYGRANTGGHGVEGSASSGRGVYGHASSGIGVYGISTTGWAAYFSGPVYVSGLLTKGGGGFRIDHPQDPAERYLTHSFVESPDMKNVYDGVVRLDAGGEARVDLPAYFETLNRDVRYQLTPLGAAAPGLHVKAEVRQGRFAIAGGAPGQRVSWQVTGIRKDAFADAHRIVAEEAKPAAERGRYLHPELYGQPASKGLAWSQRSAAVEPAPAG